MNSHAVLVADVAMNKKSEKKILLLQSYMPAQDIHVLANPQSETPWYPVKSSGKLLTPEWIFNYEDIRRFSEKGCPL